MAGVRRGIMLDYQRPGVRYRLQPLTKKYQVVRDRIVRPGGGFMEAFRMAIVEFSCLGASDFDIAGYPHASEQDALRKDWAEMSKDLRVVGRRLLDATQEVRSRDEQSEGLASTQQGEHDQKRRTA